MMKPQKRILYSMISKTPEEWLSSGVFYAVTGGLYLQTAVISAGRSTDRYSN